MNYIIGYGNDLRGEDSFGLEVANHLLSSSLQNTTIIKTFQLTPELILQLQNPEKIIFVDAAFGLEHYTLATPLKSFTSGLSHHVCPHTLIVMMNTLYHKNPTYSIYSLLTNEFDTIKDKKKFLHLITKTSKAIIKELES